MKPIRRRSKAVIEVEEDDDDDEEAQPAGNISRTLPPPDVDPLLVSKTDDGADSLSQMANSDANVPPSCQEEPIETMVFTNSLLQTCGHAPSNLSASALEFQPRVQSEAWTADEIHPDHLAISSPDFLATGCHEAPWVYQCHAPLPPTLQPLYQAVYPTDSQPYYSMQVPPTLKAEMNYSYYAWSDLLFCLGHWNRV